MSLTPSLLPRPWLFEGIIAGFGAAIGYGLGTGLAFNAFIGAADGIYSSSNATTTPGVTQPVSASRSGGPESLVSWDSLGREGRNFVGREPTTAQLTSLPGQPSKLPIRVYVGLDSASTARDRADLAVRELERTGAFDRSVLVVAGATGTGWLEPQSVDSLEYMWNGDTAIATIQYSYLLSWISTWSTRSGQPTPAASSSTRCPLAGARCRPGPGPS